MKPIISLLFQSSVDRFKKVLARQHNKGLKKYGISIERAKLKPTELMNHIEEELADAWYYIQALRESFERYGEEMYEKGLEDGKKLTEVDIKTLDRRPAEWKLY